MALVLLEAVWKSTNELGCRLSQLRGRRRVDGVGRPKFDFHTGSRRSRPRPRSAPARTVSCRWSSTTAPSRRRRRAAAGGARSRSSTACATCASGRTRARTGRSWPPSPGRGARRRRCYDCLKYAGVPEYLAYTAAAAHARGGVTGVVRGPGRRRRDDDDVALAGRGVGDRVVVVAGAHLQHTWLRSSRPNSSAIPIATDVRKLTTNRPPDPLCQSLGRGMEGQKVTANAGKFLPSPMMIATANILSMYLNPRNLLGWSSRQLRKYHKRITPNV